jgi:soluble lytic murein transglycosylase-like protein
MHTSHWQPSSRHAVPRTRRPSAKPLSPLRRAALACWQGMVRASHNSLALVGLAALALGLIGLHQPELVSQAETRTLQWLQNRAELREGEPTAFLSEVADPKSVAPATAANVADLPREQAALTQWLARRYRVAAEPVAALVQESFAMGQKAGLDPTLILAIVAIESRFNPFAQSAVGAQGLMQVMTRVHTDKYTAFGGRHAAFDPLTNLRVGVQVLKDCIARAGSVELGLRHYVGAALLGSDGGYASRVLAEQHYLKTVAQGKRVAFNAALPAVAPAAAAAAAAPTETAPAAAVAEAEDLTPSQAPSGAPPSNASAADSLALLSR